MSGLPPGWFDFARYWEREVETATKRRRDFMEREMLDHDEALTWNGAFDFLSSLPVTHPKDPR